MKSFTPKEKSEIVKQHFLKAIPIKDICNQYKITPEIFKKWKTHLIENSDLVFKQTFDKLWEVIKMIKAFQFAEEKGYKYWCSRCNI